MLVKISNEYQELQQLWNIALCAPPRFCEFKQFTTNKTPWP
jgi:hypothetical protein